MNRHNTKSLNTEMKTDLPFRYTIFHLASPEDICEAGNSISNQLL